MEREWTIQSNGLNTAMSLKRPIRRFPRCHFHNSTNTSNKSWMSECTIELALSRRQFLYLQLITVQLPLIFELSNSPCGYYHLQMKLRECIVFSCVCLFAVGDGGSHMTSIHDALDPTVLPPPQIWKLIVHNPRQDGTPLYRYPHPRHGTSLCRAPKTLNIIVQFAPSRY